MPTSPTSTATSTSTSRSATRARCPATRPEPTVRAVARRIGELGGVTTMMPTEDSIWVAEELRRRFGVPYWQFALTATDANRFALRIARQIQQAPEGARLQLVLPRLGRRDGRDHRRERRDRRRSPATSARRSIRRRRPSSSSSTTSRACAGRSRRGDIACVLTEPALTNIGIVLPRAGLPGGSRAGLPRDRDAARLRRDAHDLGRTGRLRRGLGPDARHRHDRQVARRRRAGRRLRRVPGVLERIEGDDEARLLRLGRRRRHARGQRALARGHARHARRGADRRGVRRHDRARDALPRGRAGGDRSPRRALVRRAAGRARRVPLLPGAARSAAARPRR